MKNILKNIGATETIITNYMMKPCSLMVKLSTLTRAMVCSIHPEAIWFSGVVHAAGSSCLSITNSRPFYFRLPEINSLSRIDNELVKSRTPTQIGLLTIMVGLD